MKMVIKRITMQNFKGFASAVREFDGVKEKIVGKNGAGKSTFRMAMEWVLGLSVPDVIPMIDNKEIPELEIAVTAVVDIDGMEYTFAREQKELYKVNKETGTKTKTTNESKYAIDGIEFTLTNYKQKISDILGQSYEYLEMLISASYFNSDTAKWKWNDRRKVLFDICKVDEVLEMLIEKPEYELVYNEIKKGYSTSEVKKLYARERKGYKDEITRNETLIADKQAQLTKYAEIDFEALDKQKETVSNKIARLQGANRREQKNEVLDAKNGELSKLISEITELQQADFTERNRQDNLLLSFSNQLTQLQNKGNIEKNEVASLTQSVDRYNNYISQAKTSIAEIADKVKAASEMTFAGDTKCPCCSQELPKDKVAEMVAEFDSKKERNIASIKSQEQEYLDNIKTYERKIAMTKEEIADKEKAIDRLRNEYNEIKAEAEKKRAEIENATDNKDLIASKKAAMQALKDEIANIKATEVKTAVVGEIAALQTELDEINGQLAYKTLITDIKKAIAAHKDSSLDLADKIALTEKKELALQNYVREQVSLVNDTINGKFENGVSFSLFNELYKDGDGGLEETCICMFNGKRYSSMSTGEKFFADFEVIKTLQREFGVSLPIFCDNAESVTRDYEAEQQLIELYAQRNKTIDGTVTIESIL